MEVIMLTNNAEKVYQETDYSEKETVKPQISTVNTQAEPAEAFRCKNCVNMSTRPRITSNV